MDSFFRKLAIKYGLMFTSIVTKSMLICTFYCGLSNSLNAQEKKQKTFWDWKKYTSKDFPRIYGSLGFSPYNSFIGLNKSTQKGSAGSLQAVANLEYGNFGICFQYNYRSRLSKELPNDYIATGSFLSNVPSYPSDDIFEKTLTVKRLFYTRYRLLQFSAQMGVSLMNVHRTHSFLPQSTNTGGFFNFDRPNYSYESVTTEYTGLHFRLGADAPLLPFLGLNVNAFATVVGERANYYGLETNLTLGYLRKKSPKTN